MHGRYINEQRATRFVIHYNGVFVEKLWMASRERTVYKIVYNVYKLRHARPNMITEKVHKI